MSSIAMSTSPFLYFSRALNPNYDPSNPGAAPLYADGSQASRSLTKGWYDGHETEYYKSVIASLDSASGAEKGSFQWAYARAAAQLYYYNSYFPDDVNKDAPREDLESTNPVVKVISAAMDKQASDVEKAGQSALDPNDMYLPLQSFDDLKKQSWFKDFASQLDAALQTQAPVQTHTVSKYA